MSSFHDTQIVSIYDLMIERRRKLTSEAQMKDISPVTLNGPRRKVPEDASPNNKDWRKNLQLQKKALRERASSQTLDSESTCPSNAITATHLTKKQAFMKIQPPAKKEVISKLVEKMSTVCGGPKAESVELQKSQTPRLKRGSGTQRKEMATLGTSRNKQKSGKTNPSLGNRRPLSPRKADRGPMEKKADRVSREKKTMLTTPKPKTSRLPMRMGKQSERSAKNGGPSTDRWRI